jgi:hypothetical protein
MTDNLKPFTTDVAGTVCVCVCVYVYVYACMSAKSLNMLNEEIQLKLLEHV